MNHHKDLKFRQSKTKVPWLSIFALVGMVIFFSACNKDNEDLVVEEPPEKYPSLTVVNQLNDSWRSIYRVSLVGYEFDNLNIEPYGDSQTFILDEGMSGGFEDINVTVGYIRYSVANGNASIKVDFSKGDSTKITLTGCSGAEGCDGIYLE